MADRKDKAFSAPLPLRAIGDPELAGLDLRTLACIAAHDHMSLKLGRGHGCHASHETLAAKIGCNYANLSKSIKKLEKLGYLDCTRQPGRGNFHTYRVPSQLYDYKERLSFDQPSAAARSGVSKRKVGQLANCDDEKVCLDADENQAETVSSVGQYISLNDETYSVETDEKYSFKNARLGSSSPIDWSSSFSAALAMVDRELKANRLQHRLAWLDWIAATAFSPNESVENSGWAQRLCEDLIVALPPDENEIWKARYR